MKDFVLDMLSLLGILIELSSIVIITALSAFGIYNLCIIGSWISITGGILIGIVAILIDIYIGIYSIKSFKFLIKDVWQR